MTLVNQRILGIDPGKSGGFAIHEEGELFTYKWTDAHSVSIEFESLTPRMIDFCVLEKVGAAPGQSPRSMFAFGQNFGFWEALLLYNKVPYRLVTPQEWQRGIPNAHARSSKTEHKNALKMEAARRYPHLKVTHAIADAMLIADYAKKIFSSERMQIRRDKLDLLDASAKL